MAKYVRFSALLMLFASCVAGTLLAQTANPDRALLLADHDLLRAMENRNQAAMDKLLDRDFTATDSKGKTRTRAEVMQDPSTPADNGGPETNVSARMYGGVALVLAQHGPVYIGRVWVKRSSGWRLLVYQGTKFAPAGAPSGPGVSDCENPCKTLPYKPRNGAEEGIIRSWQALETAVTHHDAAGWAPHVADDFLLIGSSRDHPFTKQDRIDILNKQKANNTPSAPSPLVSATMYDVATTVVMVAMHQPPHGNPVHVVRIWVEHGKNWQMAFSQQTSVETAQSATK